MDVDTGEVLAMAMYPTYDPADPPRHDVDTLNELMRITVLSDVYEPGSTFKMLTAAAAIDCGSLNGRAFMNVSGSGFDVEVLRKTEELKAVYPGERAYTKAVLAVLSSYKAFETEIALDGGNFKPYKGTIVEIANGQYFGGGMLVAPKSSFQDGVFDVVMVDKVPRMMIPFLLPLFKLGLHVHLPIARVIRAKEVVLRAKGMVINIDGNLKEMDEARYCVLRGALRVRLPRK